LLSDTITEEQEKNVGVNLHKFVDVSSLQPTLREEILVDQPIRQIRRYGNTTEKNKTADT